MPMNEKAFKIFEKSPDALTLTTASGSKFYKCSSCSKTFAAFSEAVIVEGTKERLTCIARCGFCGQWHKITHIY